MLLLLTCYDIGHWIISRNVPTCVFFTIEERLFLLDIFVKVMLQICCSCNPGWVIYFKIHVTFKKEFYARLFSAFIPSTQHRSPLLSYHSSSIMVSFSIILEGQVNAISHRGHQPTVINKSCHHFSHYHWTTPGICQDSIFFILHEWTWLGMFESHVYISLVK